MGRVDVVEEGGQQHRVGYAHEIGMFVTRGGMVETE
jgi:hypothetical protein